MERAKKILIPVIAILVLAGIILAAVFLPRQSRYREALSNMDNYFYEQALEQFQKLGNFRNSSALAVQMQQLTEEYLEETRKLIPNIKTEERNDCTYWSIDGKVGLNISWEMNSGMDLCVQWNEFESWGTDQAVATQLFGDLVLPQCIVRYDSQTGTYLFLQAPERSYVDERITMEEWFRGTLQEDGSLEITRNGSTYVFLPYSITISNGNSSTTEYLNENLTEYVEAGKP